MNVDLFVMFGLILGSSLVAYGAISWWRVELDERRWRRKWERNQQRNRTMGGDSEW